MESYDDNRPEHQWQIVLEMLRRGSITTKDIFEKWIMCPPKVIEYLRKVKRCNILTEPIEGKKHKKYTLISEPEPKQMQLGF